MKKDDRICGCGGHDTTRGLKHLIDSLERQREPEKPVDQSLIDTGEYPAVTPEMIAKAKDKGRR